MNRHQHLFIGGTNDGKRIELEETVSLYRVPVSVAPTIPFWDMPPETKQLEQEEFRPLKLQCEGNIWSIYVNREMTDAQAMAQLIEGYRNYRLTDDQIEQHATELMRAMYGGVFPNYVDKDRIDHIKRQVRESLLRIMQENSKTIAIPNTPATERRQLTSPA
jgi:hypothetical protein